MIPITITLPASKSISNRMLIIRALSDQHFNLFNLSTAKDTADLERCLNSKDSTLYLGEGATTLRFLLTYFAFKNCNSRLDCSDSLKQRPLLELLEVLESLNCEFQFFEKENQFPLKILSGISHPIPDLIAIDGSRSSQFISAILMIAPCLKANIKIKIIGKLVSKSYLQMTLNLMKQFGILINQTNSSISISPGKFSSNDYFVEADWSSAVFYFALLGLQQDGSLFFPELKRSGLQGDEVLCSFFEQFGIHSEDQNNGIKIIKQDCTHPQEVYYDFTDCPDLFPALIIFCALKKVNCFFSGLDHLQYKESNRLVIICDILEAQNVKIIKPEQVTGVYSFVMDEISFEFNKVYPTYHDHRIAMALSLIKWQYPIAIENPEVVEKSFPLYWDEYQILEKVWKNLSD